MNVLNILLLKIHSSAKYYGLSWRVIDCSNICELLKILVIYDTHICLSNVVMIVMSRYNANDISTLFSTVHFIL